jgi:hypothetical protein
VKEHFLQHERLFAKRGTTEFKIIDGFFLNANKKENCKPTSFLLHFKLCRLSEFIVIIKE